MRVGTVGVLTHTHIELAVLAEVYSPSVVVCSTAEVVQPEDELLTTRNDSITISGDANHPVVGRSGDRRPLRVVDIDVVVIGESRVQGDP